MPLHQESRLLPYTAEQMYAVVADVERYPEFLPWCSKLVIRTRQNVGAVELITAEMAKRTIATKKISFAISTAVPAMPPRSMIHIDGMREVLRYQ